MQTWWRPIKGRTDVARSSEELEFYSRAQGRSLISGRTSAMEAGGGASLDMRLVMPRRMGGRRLAP